MAVLHEGPGYSITLSDECHTLVPYFAVDRENGERNHGWMDLRDRPDLVALVPEAQKSAGLSDLLRAINESGSVLVSIGCDCGVVEKKPPLEDGEPPFSVDGYVGLTFRDPARNADARVFTHLSEMMLRSTQPSEEHHVQFHFTVEPLKTFFGLANCYGLMMHPRGIGRSPDEAWRAYDCATSALAAAVRCVRADMAGTRS